MNSIQVSNLRAWRYSNKYWPDSATVGQQTRQPSASQ
jgi:hypothetical protein